MFYVEASLRISRDIQESARTDIDEYKLSIRAFAWEVVHASENQVFNLIMSLVTSRLYYAQINI